MGFSIKNRHKPPKQLRLERTRLKYAKAKKFINEKKFSWIKYNIRMKEIQNEKLSNFKRLGYAGLGIKIRLQRPTMVIITSFIMHILRLIVTFRILYIRTFAVILIAAIKRRDFGTILYIAYFWIALSFVYWSLWHNFHIIVESTPMFKAIHEFIKRFFGF